jgi:hypothetical protein
MYVCLVLALCFLNKEVAFAGSKTTGLGQDITTSLTGFDVTTSKISSDRGASQKSCDVTASP